MSPSDLCREKESSCVQISIISPPRWWQTEIMLGLPPFLQGTWQSFCCFAPDPNRASVVGTKRAIAITITLKIERLRSIMVVVVVDERFCNVALLEMANNAWSKTFSFCVFWTLGFGIYGNLNRKPTSLWFSEESTFFCESFLVATFKFVYGYTLLCPFCYGSTKSRPFSQPTVFLFWEDFRLFEETIANQKIGMGSDMLGIY